MKTIKISMATFLFLLLSSVSFANNLVVSGGERLNALGTRDEIKFSLSWENSWNVSGAPANHDAAWVFIKFRACGAGSTVEWSHLRLATTSGAAGTASASGHTLGSDIVFARDILTTDRFGNAGAHNTGVMIRRSTIGIGDVVAQVCTLKVMGTATNGTVFDAGTEYDIKVFGIEMVQIPEGSYYLGDGYGNDVAGGTSNSAYSTVGSPTVPIYITAENSSYNVNDPIWTGAAGVLSATMPKGYDEVYCMKYEISQGQYVDFLNALGFTQQSNRYYGLGDFHGISYNRTLDVVSTLYPNRAAGLLSTNDCMSYLEWSCLRPMTEMEYEKICRGPSLPVLGDNVWGTNTDYNNVTEVTYPAEGQMTATNTPANVNGKGSTITNYIGTNVPGYDYGVTEVGMFARDGGETRITSGATYYGVLDMQGNVAEVTFNGSRLTDLGANAYTGIWGNGDLDASGKFIQAEWVAIHTVNAYHIRKGGYFNNAARYSISRRDDYFAGGYDGRGYSEYTMRGVR